MSPKPPRGRPREALRELVHAIVLGRPLARGADARTRRHFGDLRDRHEGWWLHDNVVGLCIAKGHRGGRMRGLCLTVLVEKKFAESKVHERHRIPRSVESRLLGVGIETDVRAVGRGRFESFVSNQRPAHPGYEIGNELGGAGTLGCVVIDNETGDRLGLSCAHVLAPNGAESLSSAPVVLYPSADSAELLNVVATAPIGKLVRVCAPDPAADAAPNNVDAAVFRPDDPRWLDRRIAELGTAPRELARVAVGASVQKVGAVTQRTWGVVQTTTLAPKLPLDDANVATFVDHIGISSFTSAGDSGALVLDAEGRAVGLHIGGFDGMSVCTPLARVLGAVGCHLDEG